ncbi:MAG TPA: DUF3649 domain-containing protein [Burkholderiaceae bacterium]|nr:DUF3649 domain-containing protein [Burkholderiaceae bacterium]
MAFKPTPLSHRLGVASRAAAAILGGYALAAACTALLAVALPIKRSDAVLTATLLSFTVYACAALWAFAARSALHAWLGIALPAALCGTGLLMYGAWP